MSHPAARRQDRALPAAGTPSAPTFTGLWSRMGTSSDLRQNDARLKPASLLERLGLRRVRADGYQPRAQNPADPVPNPLFARLFILRARGQRLPAIGHFRYQGVNYLIKDERTRADQREILHIIWSDRNGVLFQLGVAFSPPAAVGAPAAQHLANLSVDLGTPEMSRAHLTPGDWGPDDHLPLGFYRELEQAIAAFGAFMDQRVAAVAARRAKGRA
jgi:hypothetical protein